MKPKIVTSVRAKATSIGSKDVFDGVLQLPTIISHPTGYRVDYILGEWWQSYAETLWVIQAKEIAATLVAQGKTARITEMHSGEKTIAVINPETKSPLNAPDEPRRK